MPYINQLSAQSKLGYFIKMVNGEFLYDAAPQIEIKTVKRALWYEKIIVQSIVNCLSAV